VTAQLHLSASEAAVIVSHVAITTTGEAMVTLHRPRLAAYK